MYIHIRLAFIATTTSGPLNSCDKVLAIYSVEYLLSLFFEMEVSHIVHTE